VESQRVRELSGDRDRAQGKRGTTSGRSEEMPKAKTLAAARVRTCTTTKAE